jgi:hypothetical protein
MVASGQSRNRRGPIVWVLVVLGCGVIVFAWWVNQRGFTAPDQTIPLTSSVGDPSSLGAADPGKNRSDSQGEKDVQPAAAVPGVREVLEAIAQVEERLAALLAQLSPSRQTAEDLALLEQIRVILAELAARLRALPNDAVAEAMIQYLSSGRDLETGLRFQVGEGGLLSDSPTIRTFLLDLFADIDALGARDYSLGIFDASASSSEWALALRNIAWQDTAGEYRGLLRGRLSELLSRQEWLARPDSGFLEAFDPAVFLGDADALREMGSVLGVRDATGRLADNGMTHAAFLAMDRITAAHPAQTVELIQSDPEFLSWAPRHRGALMSRLDARDPVQADAAGQYLLRRDINAEERYAFLSLFPNPNGSLGDSLISQPALVAEFESGLARDRAALQLIRNWLADPRYAFAREELVRSEARLVGFVATGSGVQSR